MTIPTIQDIVTASKEMQTLTTKGYVPAKPLNWHKKYLPWAQRLKWAWAVFRCKAVAVQYPEDECYLANGITSKLGIPIEIKPKGENK
jgi:hypothetical protein